MTTVNIYLTFDGNCEEAFHFYRSVLGGEFSYVGRFRDIPPSGDMPPLSEDFADKIMHISLPVGGDTVLMGSDSGGEWAPALVKGNNFSVSVNAPSKEEADRLFNGFSAVGQITMSMEFTFWGAYFGMFTDKFGINWMINYDVNPQE